MVAIDQIQKFVDEVVKVFHPEKIILFGSYAYGTPSEDSDVDLMVVMPHDVHPSRKALEIESRVACSFYPDIKVRSSEEIRQRLEWHDFFLMDVMSKGKVLYDAYNN